VLQAVYTKKNKKKLIDIQKTYSVNPAAKHKGAQKNKNTNLLTSLQLEDLQTKI